MCGVRKDLSALACCSALLPVLLLGERKFLERIRADLSRAGVVEAICLHDSASIFDWLMGIVELQGVSDAAAVGFSRANGRATWAEVTGALSRPCGCPRLRAHWSFSGCGYRRTAHACAEPHRIDGCLVPLVPARNGRLSQAAFSLALFIRDVCGGDFVGWLDGRLAKADPGLSAVDRAARMRPAVLEPLRSVHGVSDKVLSLALADLLLAGDPGRERWVVTGASMIAVDSLVHAFLHRTGILRRAGAEHPYGPACYGERGCAVLIEDLARGFDARTVNPSFPAFFPRYVQAAIWRFCAAGGWNVCNGNRIDDDHGCQQRFCPAGLSCERRTYQFSN